MENAFSDYLPQRIYVDFGEGLSENCTIIGDVPNNGILNLCFNLLEGVKAIRFDPVEQRGCILKNLSIIGEQAKLNIISSNGIYIDRKCFFDTIDSQLYIEIPSNGIKSLEIICDIVYMEWSSFV